MREGCSSTEDLKYEWAHGVLRASGAFGFISFWKLAEAETASAIAAQAEFFRSIGQEVEWKVYGHDLPSNLTAELELAGFVPQETETFMVAEFDDLALGGQAARGSLEVRRVLDDAGFDDYIAATCGAFGSCDDETAREWRANLSDSSLQFFVAYWDGSPVAASRLELMKGKSFAGCWGGGTVPEFRGRGVYRAMVAARAMEAFKLGYRFMTVDARETSRPILERLGFRSLTTVTGWIFDPQSVAASDCK